MFISDTFLPNLLIQDESGEVLSVMTTKNVLTLLEMYKQTSSHEENSKLELLTSKIKDGKLFLIWVKLLPKNQLAKNEIRTITLSYSVAHNIKPNESMLKMRIKNKSHPLYYTLYAPKDFNFRKTKYTYFENDTIQTKDNHPQCIDHFKTYNSHLYRIVNDIDSGFEIFYSFKPDSEAISATNIATFSLVAISTFVIILKYVNPNDFYITSSLYLKEVEIGLFIIGISFILPQLTNNNAIRSRFLLIYLIPILFGGLILL